MCGITGIFAFNPIGKSSMTHITSATMSLIKRGPNFQDIYTDNWVGLGHRRLSIIDTSKAANQPMWDEEKKFAVLLNGEIFNFRELRHQLQNKGVSFKSNSDTEVLLKLFIRNKEKCLNQLNGFFSFCIYNKEDQTFFLARDRYGIKPLLYLFDNDKFIFASEMKALLHYGIEKKIDFTSLYTYLQLNYIPSPHSIFHNVKKLPPAHYLKVSQGKIEINKYYNIPCEKTLSRSISYHEAKSRFKNLLEESVKKRMISDVPLGTFLSGGIDSSIITGIARKYKSDLHTFSIGFKDESFFDETDYAISVSQHFNTNHTVFSLTNNDLYEHIHSILEYIDEPFADSSTIAVYILSKKTQKYVTVALSGDGADELLGGYNKHEAIYRMLHPKITEKIVSKLGGLWDILPHSRNNPLLNSIRQFSRFANSMKLDPKERYWQLAGFANEDESLKLLTPELINQLDHQLFQIRKDESIKSIDDIGNINSILMTDTQLVLPNDILTKVDLMSMANSLEVRVPFLDHELVNFIFSLPEDYKINHSIRKRIIQDTFREMLPPKVYNRPKKGFEVPLLKWFRNEMKPLIINDLLSKSLIEDQQIFNYETMNQLKRQLFSSNPGDTPARIWGLIVFQSWWKKIFEY